MLSLASVLFLGIVAPQAVTPVTRPLPGIERMHVSAPGRIRIHTIEKELSATGVLLLDVQSGEALFEKNADSRLPMASLTKIMTALLILERHKATDVVTIPSIAENIHGSTVGLIPGQRMTVGSLLKTLLIPSANDSAYALATFDGPGVGSFVRRMNDRAQTLGLRNTHFANPAGLDHPEQYSSARDLGWLTMSALKDERFASIVRTRNVRVSSLEGQQYDLRNTNELLHYNEDVYGVKTGTTSQAGECLIVLFHEHDHPYLLILLGSKDRYTDSLHILEAVHDASK